MTIVRMWNIPEDEQANFHSFDRKKILGADGRSFAAKTKEHLTEREKRKISRGREKKRTEKRSKGEGAGKRQESRKIQDGAAVSRPGSSQGDVEKRKKEGKDNPVGKPDDQKIFHRIAEKKHARTVGSPAEPAAEREHGEKKAERTPIQEIIEENTLTEEEYREQLRNIIIKHERLMSLSVRKEIKRAKHGNPHSQSCLAEFYAEEGTEHTDYMEAAKWYSFAARQGDLKAKFALGMLFDSGKLMGNQLVQAQGIRYFIELAEAGYPTAQSIVGMRFFYGEGLPKNREQGLKWLKKAATQGHTGAQRQLGEIYEKSNPSEARKWFRMAGAGGDRYAMERLRYLR